MSPDTHPADLTFVMDPLHRTRGWMKFLAVLLYVSAGLQVLTVVGLLLAWIPALIGVLLWQTATALGDGHPSDTVLLRRATDKLRQVFITYAVLAIVALSGFALLLGLGVIASLAEAW
ncbi:MAG TPA: DUF5362 family protein [Acidimicrobiia bacterium]|nr:DUF5362 family protein [Acidimicrobiia bacterium]